MHRVTIFLLIIMLCSGCGVVGRGCDEMSYKNITGDHGNIRVFSGGQVVATYPNAKILYSNSYSQTLFIRDSLGNDHYIQGQAIVDLQ